MSPMMPSHRCSSCGALITGRCSACARRPGARIRGRRLQQLRYQLIRQQPFCVVCRTNLATVRDHIAPLWAGGLDVESNCQMLCDDCHKAKTADEARDRYAY